MPDYMDSSKNHLANVVATGTGYTVNEGRAELDVTPNSGDVKFYIDNLPGYPTYGDDGHMLVGHAIQVRTANVNYNTAHEQITDLMYGIIEDVESATRLLRPKLAGKSPPWVSVNYEVDSYQFGDEATAQIGVVAFYFKLIIMRDDTG